jgi:sulfite exporter TauE/SafE
MDCCGTAVMDTGMAFSFLVLFGFGVTMSIGHCVGMCGPLITIVGSSQRHDGASSPVVLLRLLTYHGGRVFAYAILGGIAGLLASALTATGQGRDLQAGLSIAIGVLMLLMGVGLLSLHRFEGGGPLQKFIAPRFGRLLTTGGVKGRLALGLPNGFLPCGPVYKAAMTATATASVWKGAMAMVWFGLGTVPVLVILGMGAAQLGLKARQLFNRLGAALVLVMAVQLILRGLAVWSVVPHARLGDVVFW